MIASLGEGMRNEIYQTWFAGAFAVLAAGGVSKARADTSQIGAAAMSSTATTPLVDPSKINSTDTTTLTGTVPLRVAKAVDQGSMGQTEVISSMTLLLKRSPEQQQRFDAYVASLSNPGSPNYHKWLTAKEAGEQFGPNEKDIAAVEKWLNQQGIGIKGISSDKMTLRIMGTVGAVERAFGTQMHRYVEDGKTHFANATEQKIPSALTSVVAGVVSLSDFFPVAQVKNVGPVKRDANGHWVAANQASSNFNYLLNGSVYYDLVPADFDTIYNVNPVWSQGTPIRGAGQTVAVIEDSDVQNQDVTAFRQTFLPPDAQGIFSQINPVGVNGVANCTDPGRNPDETEAALDAEWAGAAAPDANIEMASCADTGADFGPFIAAEDLLESDTPPPIISMSYGECELASAAVGAADEAGTLWSLAAIEGVTVFVSSGDSGSAGCDQNQPAATFGLEVNGLGSSIYNISVGGTDFNDWKDPSHYWADGNGNLGQSALKYVPEMTWNDSCASPVVDAAAGYPSELVACNDPAQTFLTTVAGGGGPSFLWNQPTWQTGISGVPQTMSRATPDIALFSANGLFGHALIYCMSDTSEGGTPCNYLDPTNIAFNSAGGTSFAAPSMAGVQALINQYAGMNHGNVGPMLYQLARKEYGIAGSPLTNCGADGSGSACVFHDINVGTNDVPCFPNGADCYYVPSQNLSASSQVWGIVSSGGMQSLATSWGTNPGYDYGTGLGSVNVALLVNAIAAQDARSQIIPSTWDMYGFDESGNKQFNGPGTDTDGHSSIVMIGATTGDALFAHMNGGTVLNTNLQVIGGDGNRMGVQSTAPFDSGDVIKSVVSGLFSGRLLDQSVMVVDNAPNNTLKLSVYSYGWANFRFSYPSGWTVLGAGIVDGTNKPEAILYNSTTNQLQYWSFTCSGSINLGRLFDLTCANTVGNTFSGKSGYTPHLADLNGDGYLDIVWTSPNNDLSYWINNGQDGYEQKNGGTFAAGAVLEGAGEIAGSGNTDLIWFNPSTNQLSWWIMNGTSVTERKTMTAPTGYSLTSIEDFDGDGLADILWTNAQGDAYVWQGTGKGFTSEHVADGLGNPYAIPAGYVVQKSTLQGVVQPKTSTSNASLLVSANH
jgi:hypothetical protein